MPTKNTEITQEEFEKRLKKYAVPMKEVFEENKDALEDRATIEAFQQYYHITSALYKLRRKLKMTQAELAKKSSVPRSTISKIESGERNATLKTLVSLAAGMGKKLEFKFV